MQTLDARSLRVVLAVVRLGSIRQAAESLALAPSVVSRQIAAIERDVGLALFERSARGVMLTDAGTLILEHARRVLEDHGLLVEQLDQLRGVQQGKVRVHCGEGFVADLLENALRPFAAVYPDLRYSIQLGGTEAVLDAIANGDGDIGIAYHPVIDTRVRSLAMARQPLCVVAPPDHVVFQNPVPSLAECLAFPTALLNKGHGVTQLVARVAADAGLALAPVVETGSIDLLRRFAEQGLGLTFLPRFAIASELARATLAARALADRTLGEASAHVMVRARRRLPQSVERLAGFMAREMLAFRA